MNFVENIAHLLQNCNFCFQTRNALKYYRKSDIIVTRKFFEYLAGKIFKFEFSNFGLAAAFTLDFILDVGTSTPISTNLNEFNEHFPGILDRLNFLSLKGTRDLDNGGIDILLNWLTKQQTNNDGKQQQQKIIELRSPNDHEFKTIYSRIKEVNSLFFCNIYVADNLGNWAYLVNCPGILADMSNFGKFGFLDIIQI